MTLSAGARLHGTARETRIAQFFDVLRLYDERNEIVHGGHLGITAAAESQRTWFMAAWLLRPVLRWFSGQPSADLTDLDDEIAALPVAPWPPE